MGFDSVKSKRKLSPEGFADFFGQTSLTSGPSDGHRSAVDVWTDGWTDGRTDRRINSQTDGRTNRRSDARRWAMNGRTVGRTGGRMDEPDRRTKGRVMER